MEKKPKRPPKTIKEKKFVQEYMKSGNAVAAIRKVYNVTTDTSARSLASQTLAKLSIVEVLEHHGLTDDHFAAKIKEGMEAQRTVSAVGGKDANAGTVDFVDVPDWGAQAKFTEIGLKLKGYLQPNTNVHVDVNAPIAILLGAVKKKT